MAESGKSRAQLEILADLFSSPPRTEGELRARLSPVDPALGKSLLLERLSCAGAPPCTSATLVGALRVLGLGPYDVPALAAVLLDTSAELSGRSVALALISTLDPTRAQELAGRITPDDLMALNDAQMTAVIAAMPSAPARVAEVTQKIARQPPGGRGLRLAQIERIRRRLAIPAAFLYRDAIASEALGLEGPLVDLLVEEGGEAATLLLEELWKTAAADDARAFWAEALSRLHQAKGPPAVEIVGGEAWKGVGPDGAALVMLSLPSTVDGSFTLVRARMAAGSNLEGKALSLAPRRDRDELVASIGLAAPLALADAGARVESAARASTGPLTADAFTALSFFALARRGARPAGRAM